jgi:hypothetical protein
VGCQRGMRELWTHIVGVDDVTGDTLAQKSAQCEDTVFFESFVSYPHSTTRSLIHRPLIPSSTQKQQSFQIPSPPTLL